MDTARATTVVMQFQASLTRHAQRAPGRHPSPMHGRKIGVRELSLHLLAEIHALPEVQSGLVHPLVVQLARRYYTSAISSTPSA